VFVAGFVAADLGVTEVNDALRWNERIWQSTVGFSEWVNARERKNGDLTHGTASCRNLGADVTPSAGDIFSTERSQ
jgi:hypothetical protein